MTEFEKGAGLKAFTGPSKLGGGARRAGRGAKNAFYNAGGSKAGSTPGGEKLGPKKKPKGISDDVTHARHINQAALGFAVGGTAVGVPGVAYNQYRLRPHKQKLAASAERRQAAIGKAAPYRITSMGTAGAKKAKMAEDYQHFKDSRGVPDLSLRYLGGGAAAGGATYGMSTQGKYKTERRKIQSATRRNNKLAQNATVRKNDMNDPFGINKRDERKGPGVVGGAAAAYGGAAAGSLGGAMIAGGGPKKYAANTKQGFKIGQSRQATMPYPTGNFKEDVKAGFKAQRANQKGLKADLKAVPAIARQMKGGNIGAAVGAVGGAGAYVAHKKKQQRMYGGPVQKSFGGESAFGVDHGEISKAKDKPSSGHASAGRLVTGGLLNPVHGAVAGRKGKKLKAAGSELGAGLAGSIAAGAVSRGHAGGLGGLAGGMAGTEYANRKGYLKAQP